MCRLQNIAMRDYQESVTTRQMAGQSDPYVPICFAGDTISVKPVVTIRKLQVQFPFLVNYVLVTISVPLTVRRLKMSSGSMVPVSG